MTHSPACSVYMRPEAIFIFTQHVTEFGWGIAGEPLFRLDSTATPEPLGNTVLESLNSSRHGVPQPRDLKPMTRSLLTFARARSWKSFTQNAALILVSQEKNTIAFMPTAKNGTGFDHQPDKVVRCAPLAQDIGKTIRNLVR